MLPTTTIFHLLTPIIYNKVIGNFIKNLVNSSSK